VRLRGIGAFSAFGTAKSTIVNQQSPINNQQSIDDRHSNNQPIKQSDDPQSPQSGNPTILQSPINPELSPWPP
jgi:hypothetical protein